MNSYIFILCPPFSGSTLLWKIVSTSNTVSSLPGEGQSISEVKKVMRQAPWNPATKMPWKTIKKVWGKYWEKNKPLLLEKSPPNIIRAQEIAKHFLPAYFLIMVRNPYAHCEGLIRRNNMTAKDACEFAVRCLRQQAENVKNLNNTLCFTYEELVSSPKSVSRAIESFIPQIGRLQYTENFALRSIDGIVDRGIVNLNTKKISNLSPKSIKQINKVLLNNIDIMNFWGYECLETTFLHTFNFLKTRSGLLFSTMPSRSRRMVNRLKSSLVGYGNK